MNWLACWWRSWEITIDSNWIETITMATVLLACAVLLVRDASHLIFGNFNQTPLLGTNQFSNILNVGGGVFLIAVAITSRVWFLRIGVGLIAIAFAVHLALDGLHASPAVRYHGAVVGSVFRQIAYTIFLVAILQWFKSVVRWTPSNPGASD